MCTYPPQLDVWISRRVQQYNCFECESVDVVLRALINGSATRREYAERERCDSRAFASNEPLLIDIGANIGTYSLAAASACFEVIAFEPVPINAHKILSSARSNRMDGRLRLFSIGASDSYETFEMGFSDDNQGGVAHTAKGGGGNGDNGVSLAQLPAAPLSSVLPPLPTARPVYIKIDVEGGECRALRGLGGFLQNASNVIGMLIETGHPSTRACCEELTASPVGAFHLLHTRHRLCPRENRGGWRRGRRLSLSTLCSLAQVNGGPGVPSAWPWEIRWEPCEAPSHAGVTPQLPGL
jgi:FkbM family methyltransferase